MSGITLSLSGDAHVPTKWLKRWRFFTDMLEEGMIVEGAIIPLDRTPITDRDLMLWITLNHNMDALADSRSIEYPRRSVKELWSSTSFFVPSNGEYLMALDIGTDFDDKIREFLYCDLGHYLRSIQYRVESVPIISEEHYRTVQVAFLDGDDA